MWPASNQPRISNADIVPGLAGYVAYLYMGDNLKDEAQETCAETNNLHESLLSE